MIGLIDSGKGGLTTLATIINEGGRGEFYYLADEKNSPYGNKSKASLQKLLYDNLILLKTLGCDCAVLACNTLSLMLDENFPLPLSVLKLELPDYDSSKKTLFIATAYSVQALKKRNLNIDLMPLPELASLIDSGEYTPSYLKEKLPINNYEQVILGCTHYGLVKEDFQKFFPTSLILDMNMKTPFELASRLCKEGGVCVHINNKYKDLLNSLVKIKLTYK